MVWQYFNEEESDNKVVCRLCKQKLAYIHLDVNLQGEQATTSNTRQTSITTFVTPTHRCYDADWSEKITQFIAKISARDMLPLCFV